MGSHLVVTRFQGRLQYAVENFPVIKDKRTVIIPEVARYELTEEQATYGIEALLSLILNDKLKRWEPPPPLPPHERKPPDAKPYGA